MGSLWQTFKDAVLRFLKLKSPKPHIQWQAEWKGFLEEHVEFYRQLTTEDRLLFEQRALLFMHTTEVFNGAEPASFEDRLLVAASAIIPVWSFPKWHYFNLSTVYLLPAAFNDDFQCGQKDSLYTGMVGTGPMAGKMALSRPALYQGFRNPNDKRNVGIHEFVHLIDMADGDMDGFPERLQAYRFAIPWFELAEKKMKAIEKGRTNIDPYGASNKLEFFCVASEYFFERPQMMAKKHPKLYQALEDIYQQDRAAIVADIKKREKEICVCGSGKAYRECCLPRD
ncbi:peptidase [Pseudoteredinibacter isoporae]|nr:zinc-dependent peptidase [Pseudoteredinibacter isoporae]NHO87366.1 peptidase [Pseudoteredinibacter isoporae]NIB23190.1 peptidase [Pseudoteredinibacter isoporae]